MKKFYQVLNDSGMPASRCFNDLALYPDYNSATNHIDDLVGSMCKGEIFTIRIVKSIQDIIS